MHEQARLSRALHISKQVQTFIQAQISCLVDIVKDEGVAEGQDGPGQRPSVEGKGGLMREGGKEAGEREGGQRGEHPFVFSSTVGGISRSLAAQCPAGRRPTLFVLALPHPPG